MVAFIDSNILVYSAVDDRRTQAALDTLAEPFIISVQSLNEVTHVLRRKFRREWVDVDEAVGLIIAAALDVVAITLGMQREARRLAERHQLAIYDAQIIASALASDCVTLWSEDMHHGLVIDKRLTIRNPFAGD